MFLISCSSYTSVAILERSDSLREWADGMDYGRMGWQDKRKFLATDYTDYTDYTDSRQGQLAHG